MSNSSLIVILFVIGLPLAMMFMHRGGHANGGMGGGCGGGHGGDHGHDAKPAPGEQEKKRLLGPPGTATGATAPAPTAEHRHSALR